MKITKPPNKITFQHVINNLRHHPKKHPTLTLALLKGHT